MLGRPANPVNQSLLSVRKIRGGGCAFRLAACVPPSLTVLRHSQLRRFLKTDSTDRGKEAPVFGSRDPLFLDPSYPRTQVTECSVISGVGDQRIPSVVYWFLETLSLSFRLLALRVFSGSLRPLQRPSGAGAPLRGTAHRSADPGSSSKQPADMIENDHIWSFSGTTPCISDRTKLSTSTKMPSATISRPWGQGSETATGTGAGRGAPRRAQLSKAESRVEKACLLLGWSLHSQALVR